MTTRKPSEVQPPDHGASAALGRHTLFELYDCDRAALDDVAAVRAILLEALRRGDATIVSEVFHRFSPQGVSGVVVIAESHLAIHTWPEHGYAAIDLFTCSGAIDVAAIEAWLRVSFGSRSGERFELHRGAWARSAALSDRERNPPAPNPNPGPGLRR